VGVEIVIIAPEVHLSSVPSLSLRLSLAPSYPTHKCDVADNNRDR
jgi:hypothetical protein